KTARASDHGRPTDRTLDSREGSDHRQPTGQVELKPTVALGREHAKDTEGAQRADQIGWDASLTLDVDSAGANSRSQLGDLGKDASRRMEYRRPACKACAVSGLVAFSMPLCSLQSAHVMHRPALLV